MRLAQLLFLLLFYPLSLAAQQSQEWARVYTFDDTIVEMNTSLVTAITADISRVRFRWTFQQPQAWTGYSRLKHSSRLEVMEFNCSVRKYRPYHLTFYDASGNTIQIDDTPAEWRGVDFGSLTEKLLVSACDLIMRKPAKSSESIALEKAAEFAFAFQKELDQTKDFKPIIEKFFARDYLKRYLADHKTNWFLNLDRKTAVEVSRGELEKYYVALL
ncbi:MAG TPA: surface-adhesin E family protein, partial [Pyrinomonadaceae bacterium]